MGNIKAKQKKQKIHLDKFKIGAKEYSVEYEEKDNGNLGLCYAAIGKIVLQKKYEGQEVPQSSIEQTFYHELFHAFLAEAGIHEHDEQMVQSVSVFLHQFIVDLLKSNGSIS